MIPACSATWAEWALTCELERGHLGAHLSYSGRGGKIGAWGAGASHWERVATAGPTGTPSSTGTASGGAGPTV